MHLSKWPESFILKYIYFVMYSHKCTFKNLKKKYQEKWYKCKSQFWLTLLARLHFDTSAKSHKPPPPPTFDQILDPLVRWIRSRSQVNLQNHYKLQIFLKLFECTIESCGWRVTALMRHWADHTPLIGFWCITLCCVLSDMSIKSSHCINLLIQDSHTHITSEIYIWAFRTSANYILAKPSCFYSSLTVVFPLLTHEQFCVATVSRSTMISWCSANL